MIKTDNIDKNTEPKGSDACVSSIDGGIPEAPNSDKIQSKEAFELRKLQDRLTREALGKASVSIQSEAFEKDVNTIDTHASLSKLKVSICAKSPRNNDTTCGQTRENENPAERKKYESSTSSEQTPINSPTRVSQPMYCSSFPNSPTSMNSNSNDGYNSKFKMTVKEMAELVESASLTKFAKDRKKKARNILNNKQSKVKQNLGAALAKPMKKRVMQKNVVVRKIYSTRLSTGGASVKDDKNKRKYRTRLSTEAVEVTTTKDKVNNMTKVIEKEKELTVQPHPVTITTRASRNEFQEPEESLSNETSVEKVTTESSKEQIVIKSKSEVSNSNGKITSLKDADKASDSKKSSNDKSISVNLGKDTESKISSESSEKSEAEHQTENKRLIREMKRLGNSAGLIESNLYTSFSGSLSSSSRDSIKERPNDAKADKKYQSRDMKRLETSAGLVENNLYIVHNESSSTKEPSKQKLNDEYSAKKHLSREMMKLDNTGGMLNVESDHATRDLSREGVEDQTSKIYISREMKRLENSAGLVENKLYSLHDSSSEQQNLKELGTKRLSRERRKPEHFIDFVDSNRLFDTGSSRESSKERFVSKRVKGKGDLGLDSENEAKPAATVNSLRQKMLAARRSLNNSKTIMNTKSPTKSDKMDTKTSKNEFKIENTFVKKEYVESTNEFTKIKCKDEKPDKQSEDHAHRTRLATGSIYFDSELLKMSPSKAEKRALSLRNPGNIQGKITTGSKSSLGNKEKVQTSSSTAHKRLSLSPKKASPVNDKKHERRKSDPQGFALTTGVKQCQKCLKKFWKQKNFQAHITGTDCKDVKGTKKKVNKKRSLSQSPGMSDRTHKANDGKISDGLIAKKARVDLLGNTELKVPILTEINTSQKEKPVREPIPVTKTNISAELDNSYGNNINEMADGENAGKDLVQPVNASASDLENISEVYEKTSGTKLYSETTEKSGKTDNDDQCKKGSFHGTMMTDQQPGTSASYLGNNSDDDDTTSEFSGFSENDLKEKDTRFNDIDMNDDYETVDDSDDMFTDDSDDADDGMLAFDCEVDHAMKEVKTIDESGKVAYVEEIWIDKQPGMPVVEKTKNIKNRSYVVDVDNPLKLHCHNIKQVDKLIDENNLKCLQCETACTSISNLRRHVIRHLGWKRYKCKVCMMFACYDMSECRLHLVRTHNEKLSSCNFSRLVCDLKKEATKKRNAKRMDTLRSRKLSGEEPYKKPRQTVFTKSSSQKMTGENDIEANVENDTSLRVSGLNIKPCSGKSEKSERKPDEMSGDNTKKNISQKPTAKEEKSLMTSPVKVTEPSIKEKRDEPKITSPLYKARMNLTNALK